jgi:hypothetical protein
MLANGRYGSNSEVELVDADFCFTPESGRPADGLGCPSSADFVAEIGMQTARDGRCHF